MNKCRHCGSSNLEWNVGKRITNPVPQNRLNTNDVECFFYLGCEDCSETLDFMSAYAAMEYLPTGDIPTIARFSPVGTQLVKLPSGLYCYYDDALKAMKKLHRRDPKKAYHESGVLYKDLLTTSSAVLQDLIEVHGKARNRIYELEEELRAIKKGA